MKNLLLVYDYTVVEPLSSLFLQNYVEKRGHSADLLDIQSVPENYDFKPYDYIGFSVLNGNRKPMFEKADEIRSMGLEKKVIIGGHHTLSSSEDCKEHANYVVRGFGERILLDILDGKINEEGIYSEKNPPIDLLISNREKLYKDTKRRNNPIKNAITSFCCPYKCNYCYNTIIRRDFPDYKVTFRPVDSVLEECKELLKYPLKLIWFQDDTFGMNMKWLEEFSDRYNKEIGVPFHCNTKIDICSDERVSMYKKAGCESLTFSVECANEDLRKKLLQKPITNRQIFEGVDTLRKHNILFRTQQMIGLPETVIEDDINLLKMNCEINPMFASATIFTPMIGTPLTDYCIEKGYYTVGEECPKTLFDRSILNFPDERKSQLELLQKVFGLLTHIPRGWELGEELIKQPLEPKSLYEISKSHLFDVMYNLSKEDSKKSRGRHEIRI